MELATHVTLDRRGRGPVPVPQCGWDDVQSHTVRVLSQWELVAACQVHDHEHFVLRCGPAAAARAAQALECALGWRMKPAGCPQRTYWNPPRLTPIRDARHLWSTLGYVLRNGVASLEAPMPLWTWRWSTAWDALGLRCSGYELCRDVPQTSRSAVAEVIFGDPDWHVDPAPRLVEPAEPVAQLVRIARLAVGRAPDAPWGRRDLEIRPVAVSLARWRGWGPDAIAPTVGVSARSVRRIELLEDADPRLLAARTLLAVAGTTPLPDRPPPPGGPQRRR